MNALTKDTIRKNFRDTTFYKGHDYYKNGHVHGTVKLEEKGTNASESSYRYHKKKSLTILNGLYEKLGKPDEMLRLAMRELVDKEDYCMLAKILFKEKYFDIARALISVRPDLIDFNISLNVAFDQMSRNFDPAKYSVAQKSPDEGALLCRLRINQDILQSHVHYDKEVRC
jgi:hypothetical protein